MVENPLADWAALAHLRPPDPRAQYDWRALRAATERDRAAGKLARASYDVTKGGFFDRLQFLRGLENLLVDFLEEPPQLRTLIDMVLDYNMAWIREWLAIGVDQFCFHGDIGTQRGPLFSPAVFRKQLLPYYQEMFGACRRAGAHVWYSSDGNILPLIPDLIAAGVTLHDPQVRANTVDGIAQVYEGKLCALVDIDEQMLPFCSPAEIRAQVLEVAEKVGTPAGGLMYYLIPTSDVPLENVEALLAAYEEIRIAG